MKTDEFHETKPQDDNTQEERTTKEKSQDEKFQENNTKQDRREENIVAISLLYSNKGNYGTNPQDETNPVTVIDDEFPDPTIWLSFRDICPDDPDATITLYKESKSNLLDKT